MRERAQAVTSPGGDVDFLDGAIFDITDPSEPVQIAAPALATTTELARSLNEAVGLTPSSLSQNAFNPSWALRAGRVYRGVQPTARSGVPKEPGSSTGSRTTS